MLETRYTYRRHNSYNTKSNRVKLVKTPGKNRPSSQAPMFRWKIDCSLLEEESWRKTCWTPQTQLPSFRKTYIR
jgi:hypothetical protein